jgi:mannose-6-phosphate isomerase-like protein (cupin superfamily)
MLFQDERREKAHFTLITLAVQLAALLLHIPAIFAQDPKKLPPEIAAELARSPKPPLSNQVVGIDIDRFFGNPLLSPVRVTEGVIFERSILRHGDSYHPGDPGAVLEFWKDLSLGTMLGKARTVMTATTDEQFWYVESGTGRLDNGNQYWDLHEGIAVLIPTGARHRVENTSDEPLRMLMLSWTQGNGATPRTDILVRDIHLLRLPPQPAHWSYFGADLFAPEDGLNTNDVFSVVYMAPMTIGEPHAHIPHWDEVWIKLPPFTSYAMVGSEVRQMPPNSAYLSPPNSQTTHSQANLMLDKTQGWLYLAHATWNLGPHPNRPLVEPKSLKDLN